MKTFTSAVVVAALAYLASANVCDNMSSPTCFSTLWQEALDTASLTGERFFTTTSSGYVLTLIRIIGTPDPDTAAGTKGPVLLVSGPR